MATTDTPTAAGEPQRLAGNIRVRIKDRPGTSLGPHTHLADRRDALLARTWTSFDAELVGTTIGAEVRGIDLADDLDDPTMAELRQALCAYKVLILRDQDIDGDQQLAFARRFGELEVHPFLAGDEAAPELVHLAKDAAVGGYENVWHSDVSWRERPALGAVLRAVEVPEVGGDTLFADMAAAYESLGSSLQRRIDPLVAVHDIALSFGQAMTTAQLSESHAAFPPVEHPVVRTHPETAERILYVNPIFTSHVVGLAAEESESLLTELFRAAEQPEVQVRLRWAPGTVAIWDNRATQHYAASDYWPQRRVMQRAAIAGDRPA